MKQASSNITDSRAKLLPRITAFFFNRPFKTAIIWAILLVFGIVSYTTLLKREGFPSVSIPIVIVNGVYAVKDPALVDSDLAEPVSRIALKQSGVQSVTTTSEGNFMNAVIQYDSKTSTATAKADLERAIRRDGHVPEDSKLTFAAPYFGVTGGSTEKIDATISLYSSNNQTSVQQLTEQAKKVAEYLNKQPRTYAASYFVEDPFQTVQSAESGEQVTVQRTFDRYAEHGQTKTNFYQSVIIGVASVKNADVIKLDNEIRNSLAKLHQQPGFGDVRTTVTASYAPQIKEQISELQRVLLEGLLAVLIVGSIVIAVRASLITVLAMITVITTTLGVIYLLGYTLNVITLFALILGLSLIVDDTIIMVEAIDSARRRNTDPKIAVREAAQKIGRAMVAATLTATLSFVPLLFVGGILGSFIRAIPVTIISALLISLVAALIFIPLFARYLLLGPKQMGEGRVREVAAGLEARIARGIARPMLWANHHRKREFTVGIIAVLIGLGFIGAGGYIFQKVSFNIFPPSKDTNQLAVALTYPTGVSIEQAQSIAAEVDAATGQVLGDNLVRASYYGMANNRNATLFVDLVPYTRRGPTAPELADKIDARLKAVKNVKADAYPVDVGPPTSTFDVTINATNRTAAEKLANDMAAYLKGRKLTRTSGTVATITEANVGNTDVYQRTAGKPNLTVSAAFDGTDTTTLTTLAQKAVTDHYTPERLKEFGLAKGDITFNLGQESENQDSFKALIYAFPLVLLAIYLLLVIQFRSLIQPLLIFMALPFSFFGISLGLFLTHNSFSFFAMLGFFALIGLSIKNTILLTDYANQARRAGMGAIDAAVGALGERFRPLVATSLTAVFSLIPLAVTSPFWQGLAVVLIFGLISSTLLVILVFPYYYLGGEYLRLKVSRRAFFTWLVFVAVAVVAVVMVTDKPPLGVLAALVVTALMVVDVRGIARRRSSKV
jgi:multidrug efflux pump subunit AcrB